MAQKRTWNFGDTFTSEKARDAQKALHRAGRYTGYAVTVFDTQTLQIASGGFALLPNGIVVTETSNVLIDFSTLPSTATRYYLTIRHTDVPTLGGAAAVYELESGTLLSEVLEDGIVLAYIDHPGGGVTLQDSFITLVESQQDAIGIPTGDATGDLSGSYPDPVVSGIQGAPVSTTAPVEGDVLVFDGTDYVPTSASAAVGDGVPAAVWTIKTVTAPTNYENGFREMGVSGVVQKLVISQEIAGTSGSFIVELYKISEAGVGTKLHSDVFSLTAAAGNNARVVYTAFDPGVNELLATDRLGIKITQTQVGALEDVTVTAIMRGAALPLPPPPDSRAIVQATNTINTGTSFKQVGSIRLVPGTLDGTDSRFMIGTIGANDTAILEIRKIGSTLAIASIEVTGFLQDYALGSDVIIFEDTFYDIYIKGDGPAVVSQLKGFKLVYEPSNRRDVKQAISENVTGTAAGLIGSLYLPAGTLQAGSSFVLGTTTLTGVATLEIRRFETGSLVGTITATGLMQVVNPTSTIIITYPGFYDLYLKADSAPVTAMISGLDMVVIS